MNRTSNLSVTLLLVIATLPLAAQDSPTKEVDSETDPAVAASLHRTQAILALRNGESEKAAKAADAMLGRLPDDPSTLRLVGDIYLRTGRVNDAVKQFDRYLKLQPEALPGLWQRGIALYFAGDFQRGVQQFEEHRKVNPHDVENAAWHFLCVSKAKSIKDARRLVLPAPDDPRIPMAEVLKMLNDGDADAVVKKIASVPADSNSRADAEFYGNFYLGLYADAGGDRQRARDYLVASAKDAPHHYMGDIARVYAKYLAK